MLPGLPASGSSPSARNGTQALHRAGLHQRKIAPRDSSSKARRRASVRKWGPGAGSGVAERPARPSGQAVRAATGMGTATVSRARNPAAGRRELRRVHPRRCRAPARCAPFPFRGRTRTSAAPQDPDPRQQDATTPPKPTTGRCRFGETRLASCASDGTGVRRMQAWPLVSGARLRAPFSMTRAEVAHSGWALPWPLLESEQRFAYKAHIAYDNEFKRR
jgi:hypothetical protein